MNIFSSLYSVPTWMFPQFTQHREDAVYQFELFWLLVKLAWVTGYSEAAAVSVRRLCQEDGSSSCVTKCGARSRPTCIHSSVLFQVSGSFCRSLVLILSDCLWSLKAGEGEAVLHRKMCAHLSWPHLTDWSLTFPAVILGWPAVGLW